MPDLQTRVDALLHQADAWIAETHPRLPHSLDALARHLGYRVDYDAPSFVRGYAIGRSIAIAPDDPKPLQRWTLAHELVHCAVGPGIPESRCQRLAARLLFPLPLWSAAAAEHGADLPRLAVLFQASLDATARRLRDHLRAIYTLANAHCYWVFEVIERTGPGGRKPHRPLSREEATQLRCAHAHIVPPSTLSTSIEPGRTIRYSSWSAPRNDHPERVLQLSYPVPLPVRGEGRGGGSRHHRGPGPM